MKIYQPLAINEQGQRGNQEDTVSPATGTATTDDRTFLVCDGMGGHEAGEVASGAVCEAIAGYMRGHEDGAFDMSVLKGAIEAAYDLLAQRDTSTGQKRMGTTLTFLHLSDTDVCMAHIGDSRIYHLRPGGNPDGTTAILYKSCDHSLVNELVRAGVITPEEAIGHPKKNVITRAMQARDDRRDGATVHITNDVAAGDIFFLCSDGVLESLSDAALCELCGDDSLDDAARMARVVEICQNSHDNFSAYYVRVEDGIEAPAIASEDCELRIEVPAAAAVAAPEESGVAVSPLAETAQAAEGPEPDECVPVPPMAPAAAAAAEPMAQAAANGSASKAKTSVGSHRAMFTVAAIALAAGIGYGVYSLRSTDKTEDYDASSRSVRMDSSAKVIEEAAPASFDVDRYETAAPAEHGDRGKAPRTGGRERATTGERKNPTGSRKLHDEPVNTTPSGTKEAPDGKNKSYNIADDDNLGSSKSGAAKSIKPNPFGSQKKNPSDNPEKIGGNVSNVYNI